MDSKLHGDAIMEWVKQNYQWLFDGIGAALLVAVLGWGCTKLFAKKSKAAPSQSQASGQNSVNVQGGNDVVVGDINNNRKGN